MKKKTIEAFLAESKETLFRGTTKAFHFLEDQYGCGQPEVSAQHPEDVREANVLVQYTSPHIGVQIIWAILEGFLDVAFVELLQPGLFPSQIRFLPFKENLTVARAITLRDLVDILGHGDDPHLFLKKLDSPRAFNKRVRLIETSMSAILAGLADVTQMYASAILQGDTTIFPQIMNYYEEQVKKNPARGYLLL